MILVSCRHINRRCQNTRPGGVSGAGGMRPSVTTSIAASLRDGRLVVDAID